MLPEDIYTSMIMHDVENKWESIHHPDVDMEMLSTQDLDSWIRAASKGAEGFFRLLHLKIIHCLKTFVEIKNMLFTTITGLFCSILDSDIHLLYVRFVFSSLLRCL